MSTKSRKKSSIPAKRAAAGPRTAPKGKAEGTAPPATKRTAAASRSSNKLASGPSHKAPSKRLKPPAAGAGESKIARALPSGNPPLLAEGARAPAFRLPRDGGASVSLSDYANQKLVLFFYPRADTPGCTKEAIDFTRLSGAFHKAGTAVIGVSADPQRKQEAFRDKHKLSVPLISDEQHEMMEAYGAWGEKSMYGRTFLGVLRTTILIGADGRIARIWRHVKVDGHADAVLEAARTL